MPVSLAKNTVGEYRIKLTHWSSQTVRAITTLDFAILTADAMYEKAIADGRKPKSQFSVTVEKCLPNHKYQMAYTHIRYQGIHKWEME